MSKRIELLAPGGDLDSIKAAIAAGADAVYCGLNKFNARNRAENISFDELLGVLRLAHQNACEVFLTLNILILESEIPDLIRLLNKLVNTSIDGVIVQDLGLFYLLLTYFPSLKIHASTQLTTHNEGQIKFLDRLTAGRVNLSRELNIDEIRALSTVASQLNILAEVFVHGSYCISFSGICYMSSVRSGRSGNRGSCSQPCRDKYETTEAGFEYPLNLKDNSAFFDLDILAEAGISSLKIEGRIKDFEYVYTIVNSWRKQLDGFYRTGNVNKDNSDLYQVFNRKFSNGYLKGEITSEMFIDNPMSNSAGFHYESEEEREDQYRDRAEFRMQIKSDLDDLSIAKIPIVLALSGISGSPLKVTVASPDNSFDIISEENLSIAGPEVLDHRMIMKRFKALNDTEYYITTLDIDNLGKDQFVSYKELTSIKNKILYILNGSREYLKPLALPRLGNHSGLAERTSLAVLISSQKDIELCNTTSAEIYFWIPEGLSKRKAEFIDLFKKNESLIPWFPSLFIGPDFTAAIEFLEEVGPQKIITNNTGIAYEAFIRGISWIAGPFLNIVNSYSLLSLKENFNCTGAFISNEIKQYQIKSIKKPDNFSLHYSIYHPIMLMTSRQCLFHQLDGCEKNKIDGSCISGCEKSASIKNLNGDRSIVVKSKGNYHRVYNDLNFLNTNIIKDIPNVFSSFLIDLSDMETETKIGIEKSEAITLFEDLIDGKPGIAEELHRCINPTVNEQYRRGV